jgi:hypothetical protein
MSSMFRHPSLQILLSILVLLTFAERAKTAGDPDTQPSAATSEDQGELQSQYAQETAGLGGERSFKDGVMTIVLPRTDLWVQNDMGEIPTGAGIESRFYFFKCPCGKDRVTGVFALADYEVNDVIDVLRDGQMDVIAISPMFSSEKPRMMELRFESEGQAEGMAGVLHSALRRMGDQRADKPADTQPIK